MTDRAKKISELSATSTVSSTDKFVVLKDAANASVASTRSITVNALALSVKSLVQNNIPTSVVIANTVTVASNGTSNVAYASYPITEGMSGSSVITINAIDSTSGTSTVGHVYVAVYQTNVAITENVAKIGPSSINLDVTPTIVSNNVFLYMNRDDATATNVTLDYSITMF